MTDELWEHSSPKRPSAMPCSKCQADRDQQVLYRGPTGPAWRCTRCHAQTAVDLPFDPRAVPDGREQIIEAIETLAIYVPILANIDRGHIYRIVRPYFAAGWCTRDVLYALDYLPDGQTHPGQGSAWTRGENHNITLYRVQSRLRKWRWRDKEVDQDIMDGPYTAMTVAMKTVAAAQKDAAVARQSEWHQQVDAARQAREGGAPADARRQAEIAAGIARQMRREADSRELARAAAEIEQRQAVSMRWLSGSLAECDT